MPMIKIHLKIAAFSILPRSSPTKEGQWARNLPCFPTPSDVLVHVERQAVVPAPSPSRAPVYILLPMLPFPAPRNWGCRKERKTYLTCESLLNFPPNFMLDLSPPDILLVKKQRHYLLTFYEQVGHKLLLALQCGQIPVSSCTPRIQLCWGLKSLSQKRFRPLMSAHYQAHWAIYLEVCLDETWERGWTKLRGCVHFPVKGRRRIYV